MEVTVEGLNQAIRNAKERGLRTGNISDGDNTFDDLYRRPNIVDFWLRHIDLHAIHNMKYMVENSIKDFHFKGLNYICLQFSPTLTIRLYITEPSEPLDTKSVNIHNHLYDSQILVLKGRITNNVYEQVRGNDYNHYWLTSALAPSNMSKKIILDNIGKCNLIMADSITLNPGDTHFQHADEIHNVENDVTKLTAFMVFEFPTVKTHSILFSKKDFGTTINTDGAYNRYTAKEIRHLIDLIL